MNLCLKKFNSLTMNFHFEVICGLVELVVAIDIISVSGVGVNAIFLAVATSSIFQLSLLHLTILASFSIHFVSFTTLFSAFLDSFCSTHLSVSDSVFLYIPCSFAPPPSLPSLSAPSPLAFFSQLLPSAVSRKPASLVSAFA